MLFVDQQMFIYTWSGTLFCLLYPHPPFETNSETIHTTLVQNLCDNVFQHKSWVSFLHHLGGKLRDSAERVLVVAYFLLADGQVWYFQPQFVLSCLLLCRPVCLHWRKEKEKKLIRPFHQNIYVAFQDTSRHFQEDFWEARYQKWK